MSQYAINDTSLTAIADAIRTKAGVSKYLFWQEDYTESSLPTVFFKYNNEYYTCSKVAIPTTATGTITKFDVTFHMTSTSKHVAYAAIFGHNHTTNSYVLLKDYTDRSEVSKDRIISMATEFNSFMNNSDMDHDYLYIAKYRDPTDIYSSFKSIDSDVIAGLNPATNYLPSEMGAAISNLRGAPTDEELTFTGDCSYGLAYVSGTFLVNKYGDYISGKNINNMTSMFTSNKATDFSHIVLDCRSGSKIYASNLFDYCENMTQLPTLHNYTVGGMYSYFSNCKRLREIPSTWAENFDWSAIHTSSEQCQRVFCYCYSLRSIPLNLLSNIYCSPTTTSFSYLPYNYQYNGCYALASIPYIPVVGNNITSNAFSSTFDDCKRLNWLQFQMNQTANWKSQTIDLSFYVGYASSPTDITGYNSGLTTATRITDAASYALLKDDPDSWTTDINYSRYNHDSAVGTIASLPDTHAYGTNTIKFKGAAGALTDGGAINTLTAAEIAVATAKGWTVSLV